MPEDLVIDTNVFMHADGLACDCEYHETSRAFVEAFRDQWTTQLVVDTDFVFAGAGQNTSLIGDEYVHKLTPGSIGHATLLKLISQQRIRMVDRSETDAAVKKSIRRLVRKPRDRTFVQIAHLATSHTFVSNDYEDFQSSKRRAFKKEIGVSILDSDEWVNL